MAETKSKVKAITTPEEKLRALFRLQLIDSRIDRIRIVRGELPLEVEDLEDEIEGLVTRLKKMEDEKAGLEAEIGSKKNAIAESKAAIKKYKEQQNNVRNNREFESLAKEIEFQELEIKLADKRIKEFKAQIDGKEEVLNATREQVEGRKKDLENKRGELDEIVGETKKEEDLLTKLSNDAKANIDERLVGAYMRIRNGSKNGLAVVPIDREASAGSYIKIPPQRQLDVAARQKIIVDEHSGRILVDAELANEEQEKIDAELAKLLK
jgi:predicted  nucleic acid-binding Zn-ribbon protein